MKFVVSPFAAAIVLAVGLASVPPSSRAGNSPETITVYNAQHASLTKEWVKAFTKETGIKVDLRNGEDTEFANQIVAEGKKSPADVFLTENSPAMALVDAAELFAPVDRRDPGAGSRRIPACRWALGGDCGPQHGVCL